MKTLKFKKQWSSSVLAAALVLAPLAASAADTYTFGLNLLTGHGPETTDFATLSIDTSADFKTFTFDLKLSDSLNTIFSDSGTFVSRLIVATYSGQYPLSSTIASGTWGVEKVTLKTQDNSSGGYGWDFSDVFGTKNGEGSRLTQGEEVKWTTVFANAQNPLLASPGLLLRVQGYDWDSMYGVSAKYLPDVPVSAVPETGSFALMLAGLGLMGALARRRQRAA